jgi:predicted aconitase with swiveling domain
MAEIPMLDLVDISLLHTGDQVTVNGEEILID